MKKILMVMVMMMVAAVTFADARSDAKAAMEKARAERQEAWDNMFNYKSMDLDEFTAEYKKNHFALNSYNNEWSANLSKAFKEYQAEVKQTQKELNDIYEAAKVKEDKATDAYFDIVFGRK